MIRQLGASTDRQMYRVRSRHSMKLNPSRQMRSQPAPAMKEKPHNVTYQCIKLNTAAANWLPDVATGFGEGDL